MPSPFPGMDPWLEDPETWTDVHGMLIATLRETLGALVRPRYVVTMEERVYVDEGPEGEDPASFRPDVVVRRGRSQGRGDRREGRATAPVIVPTVIRERVKQRHLELVTRRGHEVVAVLEVLSPTNKRGPRSQSRLEYLDEREAVLRSPAHLVELDLLRAGERVPMRWALPPAAYYAILSRASRRPRCDVWPIGLRDRLPTIDLPLRGEESVPLDLQAALDLAYDRAGYDAQLDHDAVPVPPLSRADAAWARGRVAAWRR